MITANITAYLCMEQLPELKNITRNGVTTPRKQPRYDLVSMAGYWVALDKLKNYKGQLYFNLIPTDKNAYRKQAAEMLDVDLSTLWRWNNENYLSAIEVGGKRRYKLSEVNKILRKGETV
jgi:hypothetical protein